VKKIAFPLNLPANAHAVAELQGALQVCMDRDASPGWQPDRSASPSRVSAKTAVELGFAPFNLAERKTCVRDK